MNIQPLKDHDGFFQVVITGDSGAEESFLARVGDWFSLNGNPGDSVNFDPANKILSIGVHRFQKGDTAVHASLVAPFQN
jgi:hypothetical protein